MMLSCQVWHSNITSTSNQRVILVYRGWLEFSGIIEIWIFENFKICYIGRWILGISEYVSINFMQLQVLRNP